MCAKLRCATAPQDWAIVCGKGGVGQSVTVIPTRVPETALEGTSTHVLASSLAAVSPGQFLKQQREKHGIPIKAIADKTKVTRTTLQRIEDEEYTYLPAAVYLRGFIITYAKLVQVADPAQLASQYLQQMHQHTDPAVG